jgi:hypothetical protein
MTETTRQVRLGGSTLRAERAKAEAKAAGKKTKAGAKKERRARHATNSLVYAIGLGPFIKVGFTRESVSSRLAQLQTASPIPLELRETFPHFHPHRLEAFVHAMLADRRASGEWFLCSLDDVRAAVALAAGMEPSGTWDDWCELAAHHGGGVVATDWVAHKEQAAKATMAAARRQPELVATLMEWLAGGEG